MVMVRNEQTSSDKINKEKRILYVIPFDPVEKEQEGRIGFVCCLLDKDEKLLLSSVRVVFAIEINSDNPTYDTIMVKKSLGRSETDSTEEVFYLAPEDFKIVAIFAENNMYSDVLIISNQSTNSDSNIEDTPLCKQNFKPPYRSYTICDTSRTPFFSQDILKLDKFFYKGPGFNSIKDFFIVFSNLMESRYVAHKIWSLMLLNLPQSNYMLAMLYDDLNSEYYDPDKAFEYLQNCSEYLPAQKAILPKYIAASFDENGNIENPQAYALALQTAGNIIAVETDNAEAKMFLEREKTYGKSIKVTEKFQTIIGQPMKSLRFFCALSKENSEEIKKMKLSLLFEAKTNGDVNAQHNFDMHYGLTLPNSNRNRHSFVGNNNDTNNNNNNYKNNSANSSSNDEFGCDESNQTSSNSM